MLRKIIGGILFSAMVAAGGFIGAVFVFAVHVLLLLIDGGDKVFSSSASLSLFGSLPPILRALMAVFYTVGTLGGALMGVSWAQGMLRH